MAFVSKMDAAKSLSHPDWDSVKNALLELKNVRYSTVALYGKEAGQMMIEYAECQGYFISAFGEGEIEEWVVFDESKPTETVSVDISGNVDELPKCVLVSDMVAMEVTRAFYVDGVRDPNHKWKKSIDLL